MAEEFPGTITDLASQPPVMPHHVYGNDTTWAHIEQHASENPDKWFGFGPHLLPHGVDITMQEQSAKTESTQQHDGEELARFRETLSPEHEGADRARAESIVGTSEFDTLPRSEQALIETVADVGHEAIKADRIDEPRTYETNEKRAEMLAHASGWSVEKTQRLQSSIAGIKNQFAAGQIPEGAKQAIESMEKSIEHERRRMVENMDDAGKEYDRVQERRKAFQIEPRKFVADYEGKLATWQVKYERKQADKAVRGLLDTYSGPGQSIEGMNKAVDEAIALKRSSQLYIMDNAENSMNGWDVSGHQLDGQVIAAVVPGLSRDVAQQLYERHTGLGTLIDKYAADLVKEKTLWATENVCMVLDVMGINGAQDLITSSAQGSGDHTKNQYVGRLAELLRVNDESARNDLDIRLDYYRRRMETNHGEDKDLSIAINMVSSLGIKPELATDIVRSAKGDNGGQGNAIFGVGPEMAIVSISEKINHMGLDTIHTLHEEMGTTSFHRYEDEQLKFLKKVIDRDPETLARLQSGDVLASFVDATDDPGGTLAGITKGSDPSLSGGKSVVFEVGSMGGKHTADSIMQKYAEFLEERGITLDTAIIAGHGVPESGGIFLGGLRLGIGAQMEQVDSAGMRALLSRINEDGTIIINSCSQGEINPALGSSTTGEFARVANSGNNKNIAAIGLNKTSAIHLSDELGGAYTLAPGDAVIAYVDENGRVQQELIDGDSPTSDHSNVVPIRAFERAA